jgi:hydroxypyruvate isomerase
MERRSFIRNAAILGTALGVGSNAVFGKGFPSATLKQPTFVCDFAPHFGMFENHAGKDIVSQLEFMADQGFRSLEDNGMMKRPIEEQERIAAAMSRLGMHMGVFVIDGGDNWKISLATGKPEFKQLFVDTCKKAVDIAKRVNAKWLTVVPGFYERKLPIGLQTAHVIDALRAGADILAPHNLVMVLEPLSDNPDLFLRTAPQTFEICKAVNSPACKILYDVYHMQRNEGNLINTIDLCWEEIAYIQIGDNPGRKEPTTGEINYKHIFNHLHHKKGFRGVMGMEHGNAKPGKEGELALINAYREVDCK